MASSAEVAQHMRNGGGESSTTSVSERATFDENIFKPDTLTTSNKKIDFGAEVTERHITFLENALGRLTEVINEPFDGGPRTLYDALSDNESLFGFSRELLMQLTTQESDVPGSRVYKVDKPKIRE